MPKNKNNCLQEKSQRVLAVLGELYPKPETHLIHNSPFELLVATILSAQCTDARVNKVTPVLFDKWKNMEELSKARLEDLEEVIRSTGIYKNKAKNILATANLLIKDFNSKVPQNMNDLLRLPGVARKTANVVLFGAFGINSGIAVDTHVKRIAFRLGLTKEVNPDRIEKDLIEIFAQDEWGNLNHRMVWFGRDVCDAKKPRCQECDLLSICEHAKNLK